MSQGFAEIFEESLKKLEARPGSVVEATVVDISDDFVTVFAGLKSEGVIPAEQFKNAKGEVEVQVGDTVEVALESFENGFGETILSREKAKLIEAWRFIEDIHEKNESIVGQVIGQVKGGLAIDIHGIRAFLPGSLVDIKPVRDLSCFENDDIEVKLIKLDKKRNNIVVSRRAVIEQECGIERDALLEKLSEGQEVKGIVKNLTDYGAFIDLGGVDGLLHITDMAWKRVKHPSDIVSIGDEISVKILKFDEQKSRVSLGLKQLGEDPWVSIKAQFPEGTKVKGHVTNIADYGCFVEIAEGIEGLVHVSEMDWTNKNARPSKIVQLGEEVEVMILDIDIERRRISLGLKQCKENPWTVFADAFQKGDKIKGQIKSITDFGIFVGLDGEVDGLIHVSDISWSVPGEQAIREYKKGEEIESVVLSVDAERERISLGIKQLEQDPFDQYLSVHNKGDVVSGKVTSVGPKMAEIELEPDVIATMSHKDYSTESVDDLTTVLKEGDEITGQLTQVNKKTRILTVSMRAQQIADEEAAIEKYSAQAAEEGGTKLGDIFKEQLDEDASEEDKKQSQKTP